MQKSASCWLENQYCVATFDKGWPLSSCCALS